MDAKTFTSYLFTKHAKIHRLGSTLAWCLLAFTLNSQAANEIVFDPDGSGPVDEVTIQTMDWAPNSALITAQTDDPAVIPLTPDSSTVAQSYGHGALTTVADADGPVFMGGLNGDYEITFFVSNGTNISTNIDGSEVILTLDPGSDNFFQIKYDDNNATFGNALSGEGYSDGQTILTGQIVDLSGNFVASLQAPPELLDQAGGDNWAGTQTIIGEGAQALFILVDWADPEFFISGVDHGSVLPFNNSQVLAYKQINPSEAFDDTESSTFPNLVSLVGGVNGFDGPDMLLQIDPNNSFEFIPPEQACRVTGGGNDTAGLFEDDTAGWDGTTASASNPATFTEVPVGNSGKTKLQENAAYEYTMGGQAGANTAQQPQPKGEWEHNNHIGPEGLDFAFHGGTASGGPGTEIDEIICTDEGFCKQARPAPNKQIDFVGIGEFSNFSIDDTSYAGDGFHTFPGIGDVVAGSGGCKPGNGPNSCAQNPGPETGSYHWFQVHIEDLGEPGNKPEDGAICPEDGSGNDPFANPPVVDNVADCGCADFYRITIYAGFDPMLVDGEVTGAINKTDKIYEVWGYLDGGNFQIHPLTGFDLK